MQRIHPRWKSLCQYLRGQERVCILGEMSRKIRLEGLTSKKKVVLNEGDEILCQVIKDEFGQKGARLTLDMLFPVLVMMPKTDFIGSSNKKKTTTGKGY